MRFPVLLTLLLIGAPAAEAQQPPAMNRQDVWTEADKKRFLKYLDSDAPPPSGNVKEFAAPKSSGGYAPRRARYLTISAASDSLTLTDPAGKSDAQDVAFGGKLLAGGHLFSWVRYYAGVQYTPLEQKRLDGTTAHLTHYQIPAGIELALIPLGTPQTRYVLLRGGVAADKFSGSAKKTDFAAPVLGTRYSWMLGLGYEWQIPDSRWRLNLLAEAYKSMKKTDHVSYSGLGLTAGVAYTF